MQKLNSSDLEKLNSNVVLPVSLDLLQGTLNHGKIVLQKAGAVQEVNLEKVLRLLPGKRLVALAQWQEKPVICKLFYQSGHWKRHVERELFGMRLLIDGRVRAPALLQTGITADGKAAFVLTHYLQDAKSLGDILQHSEGIERAVEQKVLALLARSHDFGMWQQDMHLDNFMLCEDKIYFLDAAEMQVKTRGAALDATSSLENLALYFAQFPADHDHRIDALYEFYQQCRFANVINVPATQLRQLVLVARCRRLEAYTEKLLRSTTAHRAIKTSKHFTVFDRKMDSREFREFLADPNSFLERGEVIKAGNSSTVVKISIDSHFYLLKRYNVTSVWHYLKYLFKDSRARNSWQGALQLTMLGLSTARPLMMMEQRYASLFIHSSYYLCELVTGQDLLKLAQLQKTASPFWKEVFAAFNKLFHLLCQYQISHGDFKASNFIYANGKLHVLDLDALRFHDKESTFQKAFRKDISRFLKNWNTEAGMDELASEAHNAVSDLGAG